MPDDEDDLLKHGWDRQPAPGAAGDEQPTNLADLILQKIAQHESRQERGDVAPPVDDYEIPPKVVEVYTKYVSQHSFTRILSC